MNKKFAIEMFGEETINHKRLVRIAAPADATEDEVKQLRSDVLDQVPEPPEWHFDYSDGVCGSSEIVELIGEIHHCDPVDAELVRNSQGELVLKE